MQSISHDRREFIAKSFCLAGAAGLGAFDLLAVAAQAQTAAAADPPLGALRRLVHHRAQALQVAGQQHACGLVRAQCGSLALRLRLRRRHQRPIPRITCRTSSTTPGANTGCASACGVSRMCSTTAGVKATVALNSQVCDVFPKAIEEMKKRGWEFMGHGTTNSTTLAGLDPGAGARHHPRRPEDDRAGDRQTAARLARLRTDRDPQHPRHSRRGRRDLLRRLEQRRSAISDEGEVGKDVCDPLLQRDQRHPALSSARATPASNICAR